MLFMFKEFNENRINDKVTMILNVFLSVFMNCFMIKIDLGSSLSTTTVCVVSTFSPKNIIKKISIFMANQIYIILKSFIFVENCSHKNT